MNWLAAAGTSVWREAAAHAQKREQRHYAMLAEVGKDHRAAPVYILEKAARSLVVVLLERAAHPDPHADPQEVVRRLRDVAVLIARLEKMSDGAYDLGVGRWDPCGVERASTVRDLMRRFDEQSRGMSRNTAAMLKRLYERFDENVAALFAQFLDLAAVEKTWDLDACHDYQGRFEPVIEAAMDAALILEAHFEARVFDSPAESADDVTRGLRPLVTGCAGPPPVGP